MATSAVSSVNKTKTKQLTTSKVKLVQATYDTTDSSESESDHSKKLLSSKPTKVDQPQNLKLAENIISRKKKINLLIKDMPYKDGKENTERPSDYSHPINEPPIKPVEFFEDPNGLGATDDDVGDSIIELESDYTEIEEDSDSPASLTNINTFKIEVLKRIEEKVCNALFCTSCARTVLNFHQPFLKGSFFKTDCFDFLRKTK